jgi:sugar phosphate isomerase/epimerase
MGIAVGVLGSGNQRRWPDEVTFPYRSPNTNDFWHEAKSAEEILARYLQTAEDYPGTAVLAPESLERSESNVGTDCASFSRILNKYSVGYTADAYHLLKEWDANGREGGLSVPSKAFWADQMPHKPTHLHLAQLEGRRFPQVGDSMLLGFFARLVELGYDQRVSLECHGFEPSDYKQAIANVRTYFQ